MNHGRPDRAVTFRSIRVGGIALLAGGALWAGVAFAQTGPPQPNFYLPYGIVQMDGENLTPDVQPVIAFVNGIACGSGMTKVATAGANTPASDVGKTVFVLEVMADGSNGGERPGCGKAGSVVTFYFPASGVASPGGVFKQGPERLDVSIVKALVTAQAIPALAGDGTY